MFDFQQSITDRLKTAGWSVIANGSNLTAEHEAIASQWLLGSRRVVMKLKLKFDVSGRKVYLQETAIERSRGLPPPALSMSSYRQSGIECTEKRTDLDIKGDGGQMHYGLTRQWLERQCANEGWAFELTIGAPF